MTLLSILGYMVAGALIATIIFIFVSWNDRKESRTNAIAKMDIEIESLLYQLEQETGVKRALTFKLHNGGPKLYSGVTKYVSVMLESHSPKQEPVKHLIQSFLMDRSFMKLVTLLLIQKTLPLTTEAMEDSPLKRRYLSDGCKTGMLVELTETDSGLYFLDLSSELDEASFYNSPNYALQEQLINRIRNIYKVGNKKGLLH